MNTKELNSVKYDDITYEKIFSKITEYEVYCKYLGNIQLGKLIKSPLRTDDKTPSFNIFLTKDGQLFFTDFGKKEYTGDVVKFVKLLFDLKTYREALLHIYNDMSLDKITISTNKTNPKQTVKTIRIKRKRFTKIDIDYWNSFNISQTTLDKYNVHPIHYYTSNDIVKGRYTDDNPTYAYKVFNKFKIYKPLANKLYKWRGNTSLYDIQGYEQLPEKGNLLIITKSLKDVMVLYELGYNSVAPPSESTTIPEEVMSNLKSRFKKITLFYDRDAAGITATRKLIKLYNINYMFIPKIYNKKDISDFIKYYKLDKTQILLKHLLNENNSTKT